MKTAPQRGMTLLFVVLIMGSVSLGALAMLVRGSINGLVDANDMRIAQSVRAKAAGCLDEVLIQLQKDNDFAPLTVATGDATCTLTVSTPTTGQRLVVVGLTDLGITRSMRASVTLSPFAVTQVNEP